MPDIDLRIACRLRRVLTQLIKTGAPRRAVSIHAHEVPGKRDDGPGIFIDPRGGFDAGNDSADGRLSRPLLRESGRLRREPVARGRNGYLHVHQASGRHLVRRVGADGREAGSRKGMMTITVAIPRDPAGSNAALGQVMALFTPLALTLAPSGPAIGAPSNQRGGGRAASIEFVC